VSDSIRECEKTDDGTQVTFFGLPQRKSQIIVGDDYQPLPKSFLIDPRAYPPGVLRVLMTFLAIIQRVLIWGVTLTLGIASMVGCFWILKLLGSVSQWLLGSM
jgi:hypothetical protein